MCNVGGSCYEIRLFTLILTLQNLNFVGEKLNSGGSHPACVLD